VRRSLRIIPWLLVLAVAILSLVPRSIRPVTHIPHSVEHIAIFLAAGLAFGLVYRRRPWLQLSALLVFTAAVEAAQLLVPGRHGTLRDFALNALGVCAGLVLARLVGRRDSSAAEGQTRQKRL
jgi:VanZ family protein